MGTVEFKVTTKDGKEKTQKVPERCYNCGYFYPEFGSDDPYYKCQYSGSEGLAPCNQDEPAYDN